MGRRNGWDAIASGDEWDGGWKRIAKQDYPRLHRQLRSTTPRLNSKHHGYSFAVKIVYINKSGVWTLNFGVGYHVLHLTASPTSQRAQSVKKSIFQIEKTTAKWMLKSVRTINENNYAFVKAEQWMVLAYWRLQVLGGHFLSERKYRWTKTGRKYRSVISVKCVQ